MISSGYNMLDLYREAQYRWLKPAEIFYILQNHENDQLSNEPPQLPPSGSLFLFNKRVTRFFRRDGHNWRKKKDQRTVGEAHEKLKVGNVEALNCYYAHGEEYTNFQRRSYWMLDPAQDHIVLVHYRDINEGKSIPASESTSTSPMLNSSASTTFYSTQNQCSTSIMTAVNGSYQIFSPGSIEDSSEVVYSNNASDHLQGVHGEEPFSFEEGLQKLRVQLSLDDDIIQANGPFISEDDLSNSAGYSAFEAEMVNRQQLFPDDPLCSARYQLPPENNGKQDNFVNHVGFQGIDDNDSTVGEEDPLLKELLEPWVKPLSSSCESTPQGIQGYEWLDTTNHQENFKIPAYPFEAQIRADAEYYQLFEQFMPPDGPNLTISEAQKYTIQEISPEWAYSSEAAKVIIVGSFLCNSSVSSWMCMFGEVEVPVEMIKDGVFRCEAPPCSPGRVTLCITTGNRESCSEVREFEYRAKSADVCAQCKSASSEAPWSTKELQVLARISQTLLCNLPMPQVDSEISQSHQQKDSKVDSGPLNDIIEGLKDGTATSSQATSLLLNELLKDKLHQWLSIRTRERGDQNVCSLSKEEQGIIHMVAALGFEWALKPILDCGVNINFRDIRGRTPLHWAAQFGREKMVAALIACGAYAGAVTDPSKTDPTGKTAASIAASNGYKGLAGYLSEVSLTTHLSSVTLQECELSRVSAEVEVERTINSVSGERNVSSYEDQLSLEDSLAAVRSAALAAARIQAAFRAHSFRKHRQREGAFDDEYGMSASDIQALSRIASSRRDHNSAALSIQKKYRGWKGRKDFLALRQKVVKIQAHVRGYQVRKHYKVLCWSVGILDRVILRWRRKGVGLKNFLHEREAKEDSDNEDEDILTLFRQQNMDRALDEAVSRVLSMVESPQSRQQYRRLLESYRKAKAEGGSFSTSGDSTDL